MLINTSVRATCNQWLDLALAGVRLIFAGLIAFASGGGCGNGVGPAMPGVISLAWSITDRNGQPATCTQVNAQSVALQLRNHAAGNVVAAAFPCTDSPDTAQVAAGLYDITMELQAADGTRLATVPDQANITIVSGQLKRLTSVTFAASTQSSLMLSLATPATTNCQAIGMKGAGITGTMLTLIRSGAGCAPVTFVRTVGSSQRGTYTVNCSSPIVAPCVEKDEILTTSLAAGTYTIHVGGKIGAIECWQRDDVLEVPPPGKPLIRTLDLAHLNIPGC
jgi:hypothetical protein